MTFLDSIYIAGTVIGFAVYASLMQRQNKLIERQNEIFDEQTRLMRGRKGKATMPVPTRAIHLKNYWPMLTMAGLTLLTWSAVGYDIYDRYHQSVRSDGENAIASWCTPDMRTNCTGVIDGTSLLQWQNNYRVALVCGFNDPSIDKGDDTRITVTRAFSIQPAQFPVTASQSKEMADGLTTILDRAAKNWPPGTKQGDPIAVSWQPWWQLIVLPNGVDASDVHRLLDVPRLGGVIIPMGRSCIAGEKRNAS